MVLATRIPVSAEILADVTQTCCVVDCQTAHHWLIDTPKGESSIGRCKHCPAVRQFSNSVKKESTFNRQYKRMSREQRDTEADRIMEELRRLTEIDKVGVV